MIAAGSLVRSNVLPYEVVGGVSAKVIKCRFSETIIKKLLMFDFSKRTKEKIMENQVALYQQIAEDNIDDIFNDFERNVSELVQG